MANKKANMIECDVVVVGAGLVGLAAVIALTEQGKRVVLVDAQKKVVHQTQDWDARIYALTPATEDFLKSLGVWSLIDSARINNVEAMALWGADAEQPLNLYADDANVAKLACIAENNNIMQALWRKLDALEVPVLMGATCHNIRYDEDAIVLGLENDHQVSASLLVAADGANSFVRRQLGIATKTKDFNQIALVANYHAEKEHGNVARQWFSPHETLALLPLPEQQVSMVWSLETEPAQHLLGLTSDALAERVQKQSNQVLGKLQPVSKTFSFALQQVTANTLIAERVVLIGDAAHRVHPMAGQGANLGFRDVISLEKLMVSSHPLQDIGELSFLRKYERTRKADILSMNTLTSGLDYLFSFESATVKKVRNIGMQQLDKHQNIKQILIKQAIA
jgi:2-polyprenylphenol 6-hydroxylase